MCGSLVYGQGSSPDAVARSASERVWDFGLTGGLLFTTIEGDMTEDNTYTANFNIGVFAARDIFPPLGLRVELYYAGLGTGFASVSDSKLRFNYIVLPALFTYNFRPNFTLGLGPYLGFLVNARDRGDDYEADITDSVSGLDVGAKIGVYFDASQTVNLAVLFQRGFINTQDGERVSTLKRYNQCVMFTVSLNISSLLSANQ